MTVTKVNIIHKCTQWSAKAESEAQQEGLGALEGLLAVVGLEVMTEGIRLIELRRDRRREFQTLWAVSAK